MVESSTRVERYLERLSQDLEALGPQESAEVVAEVRAHLADAIADAGGDEEAGLSLFGSADVLGSRILEERGVVLGGGAMPESAAWQQGLAWLVDVLLWLAGVVAIYVTLGQLSLRIALAAGPSIEFFAVASYVVIAVTLAAAVALGYWLIRVRRAPGTHALGMRLLGLRRIRSAQQTRVVRVRQVPGLRRPSLLGSSAAVVLGLAVILGFGWMWAQGSQVRSEGSVVTAVEEASGAVRAVSGLYQRAVRDMDVEGTRDTYAPSAKQGVAALAARQRAGGVAAYSVEMIGLTDATPRVGLPAPGHALGAVVTVDEYGAISETIHTAWQYRLRYSEVTNADGSSGWGWRITSVAPAASE